MSLLDKVLDRIGVEKYEDLSPQEQETFHTMADSLSETKLTLEAFGGYIRELRQRVELELTSMGMKRPSFWAYMFNWRKEEGLKARLRNYLLLEAFLDSPGKAKKKVNEALAGMGVSVDKK